MSQKNIQPFVSLLIHRLDCFKEEGQQKMSSPVFYVSTFIGQEMISKKTARMPILFPKLKYLFKFTKYM